MTSRPRADRPQTSRPRIIQRGQARQAREQAAQQDQRPTPEALEAQAAQERFREAQQALGGRSVMEFVAEGGSVEVLRDLGVPPETITALQQVQPFLNGDQTVEVGQALEAGVEPEALAQIVPRESVQQAREGLQQRREQQEALERLQETEGITVEEGRIEVEDLEAADQEDLLTVGFTEEQLQAAPGPQQERQEERTFQQELSAFRGDFPTGWSLSRAAGGIREAVAQGWDPDAPNNERLAARRGADAMDDWMTGVTVARDNIRHDIRNARQTIRVAQERMGRSDDPERHRPLLEEGERRLQEAQQRLQEFQQVAPEIRTFFESVRQDQIRELGGRGTAAPITDIEASALAGTGDIGETDAPEDATAFQERNAALNALAEQGLAEVGDDGQVQVDVGEAVQQGVARETLLDAGFTEEQISEAAQRRRDLGAAQEALQEAQETGIITEDIRERLEQVMDPEEVDAIRGTLRAQQQQIGDISSEVRAEAQSALQEAQETGVITGQTRETLARVMSPENVDTLRSALRTRQAQLGDLRAERQATLSRLQGQDLADDAGRVDIQGALAAGEAESVYTLFSRDEVRDALATREAIAQRSSAIPFMEEVRRTGEAVRVAGEDIDDIERGIEERKESLRQADPEMPEGMFQQDPEIQRLEARKAALRDIQERVISGRLSTGEANTLKEGGALPADPEFDQEIEQLSQEIAVFEGRSGEVNPLVPEGAEEILPAGLVFEQERPLGRGGGVTSSEKASLERQRDLIEKAKMLVESGHLTNEEAKDFVASIPENVTEEDRIAADQALSDRLFVSSFVPLATVPALAAGTAVGWEGDSPQERGLNIALGVIGGTATGGAAVRASRSAQLLPTADRLGHILEGVRHAEGMGLVEVFRSPVRLAREVGKRSRIAPVTAARTDFLPLVSLGRLETTARIPTEAGQVVSRPTSTVPIPEEIVTLLSPKVEAAKVRAATKRVANRSERMAEAAEAAGNAEEAAGLRQAAERMRQRGQQLTAGSRSDVLRVRDEVTRMMVEGHRAEVPVGSTSEIGQLGTLTAEPTRAAKVLDRVLIHGVKDGRNYMIPNLVPLGREKRGLFTTPELYSNFTRQTASGREVPILPTTQAAIDAGKLPDEQVRSVVMFTDDALIDSALKSRGTGFYKPPTGPRVAEIEEVIEFGTALPSPSQTLFTHDTDGTVLRVLVVGPKLSKSQIAKMKLMAPHDLLENVFRPSMWFKPSRQAEAALERGIQQGRQVDDLVKQAEEARLAGRAEEAADLLVQADRVGVRAVENVAAAQRASTGALTGAAAVPAVLYSGDKIDSNLEITTRGGLDDGIERSVTGSAVQPVHSGRDSLLRDRPSGTPEVPTPERSLTRRLGDGQPDREAAVRLSAESEASEARRLTTRSFERPAPRGTPLDGEQRVAPSPLEQQRAPLAEPPPPGEGTPIRGPGTPSTGPTTGPGRIPTGGTEPERIPTPGRVPDSPDIPPPGRVPTPDRAPPPVTPPAPPDEPPRRRILLPDFDDAPSQPAPKKSPRIIGISRGAVGETAVDLGTGSHRTVQDIDEVPNRPTKDSFTVLQTSPDRTGPKRIPWGALDQIIFPDGGQVFVKAGTPLMDATRKKDMEALDSGQPIAKRPKGSPLRDGTPKARGIKGRGGLQGGK